MCYDWKYFKDTVNDLYQEVRIDISVVWRSIGRSQFIFEIKVFSEALEALIHIK